MKKLSWCAAALALWCSAFASAADSPLELVSKDADVVVRIKSFDNTIENMAALANAVQPGTGDLVSQNATAFGLVLSNPAMAGVDRTKDFYLFLFVREEGEPKALFAIPTTDGAALQGGLPKNFVSEVRESWVFYADDDHGVPSAVSGTESLATALNGSKGLSLLNDSDIGVHLNVEHITSVYASKIREERQKIEEQLQNGLNTPGVENAAGAVEILKAELKIADQVLQDMESLTIGVSASEEGLTIKDYAAFEDGSEVAKFLDAHPKSAFKALSRLSADQPVYLGLSGDLKKITDLAMELAGPMLSEAALQKGMQDYTALMIKSKSNAFVTSFDLSGGESGLFASTNVIETKAAADLIATTRSMSASVKSMKINNIEQQVKLEPEAETYGTRKVDVMTMTQKVDPNQKDAEKIEKMFKVMFGEKGMQTRFVALADGFLQVQGGGKPAMEAALKAYDANSTSLSEEREGLAAESNILVLLDLPGLVKNGLLAATSMPDLPLPFEESAIESIEIPSSYIGSTTIIDSHGVAIDTHIPTEQFQGIMQLVMFFQSQRR